MAQANYNNDGATGLNAIAIGTNASATDTSGVALGASATAGGVGAVAVGGASIARGANATAIGYQATSLADSAMAVGASAQAIGVQTTAIGTGAVASGANSVALGSGSVATEANTVSVGSSGSERRITNVAAGVNPTDAVNVSQLRSVQQSVNDVARTAYAGVAMAGALAGLPQVEPGKSFTMGAGIGTYGGYTALAVGGSMRFTPNVIAKMGFSTTNGSRMMFNAGFGYSW
ncbi:YadA family autotransporter adhesin [Paraburkholderia kururiensis]|uniref:YadA family autotransporter adhesin n=1 Tax=Paraburkholderia kururiensis TaxID=984307 RepID=UPI001E4D9D85|nr:YadA-like family protein [Paraburkholderia kururiensis]